MKSRNIKVQMLKEFLNDRIQAKHYTKMIKRLTIYPNK
jgi:hypothetical protein